MTPCHVAFEGSEAICAVTPTSMSANASPDGRIISRRKGAAANHGGKVAKGFVSRLQKTNTENTFGSWKRQSLTLTLK